MNEAEVVFENIIARRTTKPNRYSEKVVDEAHIEKMLNAAHWAPTHGHTEPWQFNVYTGAGKQKLLNFLDKWMLDEGDNEIKRQKIADRINQSSHIISIGMKRGSNPKIPEIEELLAVAMAVQNMWLVAESLGLGAYWSSGERAYKPRMKAFLGLDEVDQSLGFLYVGNLAHETLAGHRLTTISQHVKWIKD